MLSYSLVRLVFRDVYFRKQNLRKNQDNPAAAAN